MQAREGRLGPFTFQHHFHQVLASYMGLCKCLCKGTVMKMRTALLCRPSELNAGPYHLHMLTTCQAQQSVPARCPSHT